MEFLGIVSTNWHIPVSAEKNSIVKEAYEAWLSPPYLYKNHSLKPNLSTNRISTIPEHKILRRHTVRQGTLTVVRPHGTMGGNVAQRSSAMKGFLLWTGVTDGMKYYYVHRLNGYEIGIVEGQGRA
jgi:hypothetical protein